MATETILVVENNAVVRKIVEAILVNGGFEVLSASSAQKAMLLEVSYPGTIHLLLTECMMADMCGPDLAKAMKERRPGLRVILIAACPDGGLLVLNYGWHFIKKLFIRTALLERVRDVLGSELRDQGTESFDERVGRDRARFGPASSGSAG